MTSIAIYPDQDLFCTSHNPILIYLNTQTPYSLTASFEKLEETEDFILVRKMPGPADQLYVLYLPDSDKFVALRYNADAEYIASLLEIPLHAIKVTPPQLSVGFLSRWTMRDAQRGTQYGVIDLESECGIFLLTIAREPDGERMEPDVVITLLEAETDSYFQGVFESERKGTLRLFGDWFESDTSNPVTRWRWNYEKWTHWLNRFRDDLAEEICLETDGMLLRFHITRMFQSHT